uniref:Uncharacterized protein n=1 Tax=Lactuca sativa TaxID=4236 RepID=A0A9R1XMS6_LACSA|nr:hypothetical protein LSAT_V11C300148310 [Lactuca sativa]
MKIISLSFTQKEDFSDYPRISERNTTRIESDRSGFCCLISFLVRKKLIVKYDARKQHGQFSSSVDEAEADVHKHVSGEQLFFN